MAIAVIPAFAQDPYMDTTMQQSSNSGVEHFVFWKEYFYAMDSGTSKGISYFADSSLTSYASNAAGRWNAVKPNRNDNMYSVPVESNADMIVKYASCPNNANFLGCFTIQSYYNLSSHSVKVWRLSKIYIKIGQSGANWTTSSLTGAIGHEMGHAYGLGEQYISPYCNGSRFSLMDGAYVNGSGFITLCDTEYPAAWDVDRWREYKLSFGYTFDYYNTWGDGTAITYWKDRVWNDHQLEAHWYWGNGANGPWNYIGRSNHVNNNGSHENVSPAYAWRINAWINPGFYGVHNKYLQVCAFPLYNWVDVGPIGCTVFFYPY
jgi:hypothetical protein